MQQQLPRHSPISGASTPIAAQQMLPPGQHVSPAIANAGLPGTPQSPRQRSRSKPGRQSVPPTPQQVVASLPLQSSLPQQPQQQRMVPPSPIMTQVSSADSVPASAVTAPTESRNDVVTYVPKTRRLDLHGGFNVSILAGLGDEIETVRGSYPLLQELGEISLHALTMSLRSLIPGELKVSLDTLLLITREQHILIPVSECEDLIDALLDCGEVCVEKISALDVELPPTPPAEGERVVAEYDTYEAMSLATREEFDGFAAPLPAGTVKQKLAVLAERLASVTTILRNVSFYEPNQVFLATYQPMYRFIVGLVRDLANGGALTQRVSAGMRISLIKDCIVILSNIAHEVRLVGSEDARWLLALVSGFIPGLDHRFTINGTTSTVWPPYVPLKHRYLALAVDVLAKLLARERPNLKLLRQVLVPERSKNPAQDAQLVGKLFFLCLCTFPRLTDSQLLPRAFEVRRPVLEQSMFAAELLARIVSQSDDAEAEEFDVVLKSVMAYVDLCMKPFLLRAARVLQGFVTAPPPRGAPQNPAAAAAAALQMSNNDINPFARVVRKGTSVVNMLRKRSEGEDAASSADVDLEVLVLRM